jgi:hypothetical protein
MHEPSSEAEDQNLPQWVNPEVWTQIQDNWQEALPSMLEENQELITALENKLIRLTTNPDQAKSPTETQELKSRLEDLNQLVEHIKLAIDRGQGQPYQKTIWQQ